MRERPIDGYLYRKRTPRHSTEQVAGHDARDATVRLNRLRSPFSDVEWLRIEGNLCWRRIRHGSRAHAVDALASRKVRHDEPKKSVKWPLRYP